MSFHFQKINCYQPAGAVLQEDIAARAENFDPRAGRALPGEPLPGQRPGIKSPSRRGAAALLARHHLQPYGAIVFQVKHVASSIASFERLFKFLHGIHRLTIHLEHYITGFYVGLFGW